MFVFYFSSLTAQDRFSNCQTSDKTKKEENTKMNTTISHYVKDCSILAGSYSVIVEFPSDTYVVNQVITAVLYCILSIPVIFLNAITVLTIVKCRQLKTKVCHFPVLIQSLADLTVGLLTLPLFAYVNLSEVYGSPDCLLSYILSTIAFIPWGLSLAALCALTFERYMGVMYPVAHLNHVTKKKFIIYVCAVLLVTLILVPLAVASVIFYYIFCGVYAIVPLFLHTFCYAKILYSARKRFQREETTSASTDAQTDPKLSNHVASREKRKYSMKEVKLAKSCALVVVTFYVCCVPGEILNIYYLEIDYIIYRVVISWYAATLGINTILNSLIFFWTRPILRQEAFRVLKSLCGN